MEVSSKKTLSTFSEKIETGTTAYDKPDKGSKFVKKTFQGLFPTKMLVKFIKDDPIFHLALRSNGRRGLRDIFQKKERILNETPLNGQCIPVIVILLLTSFLKKKQS
jgi:hypothetical protein